MKAGIQFGVEPRTLSKIVPDVWEFAGQFVRDDFRKGPLCSMLHIKLCSIVPSGALGAIITDKTAKIRCICIKLVEVG